MLRLMLGAHNALSCPGESDFLFDHLESDGEKWRYDRARLKMNRIYRASPMELPENVDGLPALERMIDQARETPESRPVLVLHRHAEKAIELLPNTVTTRLWPPARGEVVSLCYVDIVVGNDVVCDGGGDAGWRAGRD
jgi:hypothetical protein